VRARRAADVGGVEGDAGEEGVVERHPPFDLDLGEADPPAVDPLGVQPIGADHRSGDRELRRVGGPEGHPLDLRSGRPVVDRLGGKGRMDHRRIGVGLGGCAARQQPVEQGGGDPRDGRRPGRVEIGVEDVDLLLGQDARGLGAHLRPGHDDVLGDLEPDRDRDRCARRRAHHFAVELLVELAVDRQVGLLLPGFENVWVDLRAARIHRHAVELAGRVFDLEHLGLDAGQGEVRGRGGDHRQRAHRDAGAGRDDGEGRARGPAPRLGCRETGRDEQGDREEQQQGSPPGEAHRISPSGVR
jgi:hypothetical protein